MTRHATSVRLTDHDWQQAGDAWGHAATDWSCLYEHYSIAVLMAIYQRVEISEGTELLDIACGSGLAMRFAHAAGASVSGIDAASSLLEIAQDRTPQADVRLGSMFELPWNDDSFDVVTSINGIWGGCDEALHEAARVLRPGGHIAISFWGDGTPNDLRGCFLAFAEHAPEQHLGSMRKLNNIAFPGVAEAMLAGAGFEVLERGRRVSEIEWPDADVAWRALSSTGPAVPALECGETAQVRASVLDAIEHCRDQHGAYRFRNDHHFVIARTPT